MSWLALLAFIPSPDRGVVHIGPVPLRAYGVLIAIAVLVAAWWTGRRAEQRGISPDDFAGIATWAVIGGLIGARLYHVATDYQLYTHHPLNAFKITEGGLGIWGAIGGGVIAGVIV